MKTFEVGGVVRPIDEILDGTLHVQALRAEMQAEINRLANAGLECAYGETMATEEIEYWVNLASTHQLMIDDLAAKLANKEIECGEAQEQAADLSEKLDAANAELHELRIRAGLVAELEETNRGLETALDLAVQYAPQVKGHIPVGSKITTRRGYPPAFLDGEELRGHLPAGATGEVVGHTADGRAKIEFDGEIHTFHNLNELSVEMMSAAKVSN